MKIINVYTRVKRIMEADIMTRDDDGLLIARFDAELNPMVYGLTYVQVMSDRAGLGLPSCESIRRARQKVQEEYPELQGSERAKKARQQKREEIEEFVREEQP